MLQLHLKDKNKIFTVLPYLFKALLLEKRLILIMTTHTKDMKKSRSLTRLTALQSSQKILCTFLQHLVAPNIASV